MEAKIEGFSKKLQKIAASAKLLAHPARVAILEFLSSQEVCMTGDISGHLPLSRGSVNQHLTALKEAGWVKGTIRGSKICYCLDNKKIISDTDELSAFLKKSRSKSESSC